MLAAPGKASPGRSKVLDFTPKDNLGPMLKPGLHNHQILNKTDKAGSLNRRTLEKLTRISESLASALEDGTFIESIGKDIKAGKEICLYLWPFIKGLPDNISSVKEKLAASFSEPETAAALAPGLKLLQQLADDERHYQNLYLNQCRLAGLSPEDLQEVVKKVQESTSPYADLSKAMDQFCQASSPREGVLAIITAELAATQFARIALPAFEAYFAGKPQQYPRELVDTGLEWLRLHAKPNTRHAIWMRRLLLVVEEEAEQDQDNRELSNIGTPGDPGSSNYSEPAVDKITNSLKAIWKNDEHVLN
ncbi:MAG: hypothetical protein K2Y32_09745 [Candidatus Obscuribacterales bacterium]|nr:hypothetical protein [Candidatus Obscuribacterales bacterium]